MSTSLWPYGTTWHEAARTLTLPEGTRAGIGPALSGSGGSGGYASVSSTVPN
ncbi:hypothetical protein [Kineococcus sp. SYSU DK005]|uniref:hypothetical protein n=1 Tax=Kineococcus sp. SYSU DK005 TaxID=3383126 RepID=UPI003D7C7E68